LLERNKVMKLYYPAIFFVEANGITVEFPDLPGCVTQGATLEEAFEMAEDAACGWILTSIEDGEDIPSPSSHTQAREFGEFVNFVCLDIDAYAKQYSVKSVKKTLTIPEWLNYLAEKQGLNFSHELQKALKVSLGLTANVFEDCITTLQQSTNKLEQLVPVISTRIQLAEDVGTVTKSKSNGIISFPRSDNRRVSLC